MWLLVLLPLPHSVVGIPGGVSGELYPALAEAAARVGIALRAGVGSDADTLGTGFVWVLDSAAFPFRAAELYHQFHGEPSVSFYCTFHSLPPSFNHGGCAWLLRRVHARRAVSGVLQRPARRRTAERAHSAHGLSRGIERVVPMSLCIASSSFAVVAQSNGCILVVTVQSAVII